MGAQGLTHLGGLRAAPAMRSQGACSRKGPCRPVVSWTGHPTPSATVINVHKVS